MCDASDFCYELEGGKHTTYARVYGPDRPDRVLHRGDGFSLLADMSPLMVGHCLLVPHKHYVSFGQAARVEPKLDTHFRSVAERYIATFGELAVVEHGSSSDMRGSACILHAHLHLLPMPTQPIVDRISADGLIMQEAKRWDDLIEMHVRDEPYYLVASLGATTVARVTRHLPKQYLRRVVASVLGLEEALSDWVIIHQPGALHKTIALWKERSPE